MADALSNAPVPVGSDAPKKPLLGLSFLENLSEMSMLRQIGLLVGLRSLILAEPLRMAPMRAAV